MDGKASNEMEDQTSTFLNNLNSHAEPDDDYDESEPLYADDLPYSSSTTSGARATLQGSCISRPFNISALKSHVIIMMRDDGNGRRRRQRCYDYANTIMKNLPCYLCITAATLAFASILDSTWFQDNDGNGIISSLIIKTGVKSSVKYAGTRMNNNFPTELLGTVYSISDFDDYYDKKRIPYWDDLYELIRDGDWPASLSKTLTNASNGSSSSSMETSFLKENDDQDNDDDDLYRGIPKRFHDQEQWGPCYPYHNRPNINWRIFSGAQLIHTTQPDNTSITSSSNKTTVTDTAAVLSTPTISYPKKEIIQARQNGNNNNNNNNYYINHLQKQSNGHQQQQQQVDTSGMCRPGFLIIGAGKCGTSSLYHYLTDGHPRILPAVQKQIGYFTVRKILLFIPAFV